jgi:hypothetical protein
MRSTDWISSLGVAKGETCYIHIALAICCTGLWQFARLYHMCPIADPVIELSTHQSKDRVCGPNARCLASRTIDSDHDDLVVLARMDRELEIVSASLSADTMYEYCSFSVSRHNASLPALSHCSGEQYVHGAKLPVHPGSLGCRRVHAQKREASL